MLQHRAAEALEAAGEVADGQAEHAPRVPGATAAHEPADEAPVSDAAARDVARPEHEIGVLGGGDQARQVSRAMREVRVHLEHELSTAVERSAEAGQVGGAKTLLARAVQNLEAMDLTREPIRDRARAVRRVVVDDEDPVAL